MKEGEEEEKEGGEKGTGEEDGGQQYDIHIPIGV